MRLIVLIFILSFSSSVLSSNHTPKIFFNYSFLFERLCPQASTQLITKEQKEFVRDFENEASHLYVNQVQKYFKELEITFPKSHFKRNELTATLTLCREFGSFSEPLTINMHRIAEHKLKNPNSSHYQVMFTEVLFHELLHTWQVENFDFWNLNLIKKYKNENRKVLTHIYLLAIEEYTFRKLNLKDHIKRIQWLYPRMGKDYQRAWSIVQEEGYLSFISDLKLNSK